MPTLHEILKAKELLDKQDVPKEGRIVYMSEQLYSDLEDECKQKGFPLVDKIYGCEIRIV